MDGWGEALAAKACDDRGGIGLASGLADLFLDRGGDSGRRWWRFAGHTVFIGQAIVGVLLLQYSSLAGLGSR